MVCDTAPFLVINLHAMFGDLAFRLDMFFSENVNKISKAGHSDLFLICDTPLITIRETWYQGLMFLDLKL